MLFNSFNNTYFIQLHGFTKTSTDPYVVLSNGTQQTPSPDYISILKNNLYLEDTVLTFKIAHIDTSWTSLRGFYNTQGRLINNSPDYCDSKAINTSGNFIHMEQERVRLRSDVTAWNKLVNVLNNTFVCSHISIEEQDFHSELKVYPNPTQESICIEWNNNGYFDQQNFIYNMLGQNLSAAVTVNSLQKSKVTASLSNFPSGMYIIKVNNSTAKIYKN